MLLLYLFVFLPGLAVIYLLYQKEPGYALLAVLALAVIAGV